MQKSDGSCNVTSDSELLYKLFKKQPLSFCKNILKKYCELKILYCSPRWKDVLPTQLQIIHYSRRQHKRVVTKIECILFQLTTRGLPVYTFQVPHQWQSCCQEWTTLWTSAEGSSFQPPNQRSGQITQHREKETLEEKVKKKHLLSSF